ncbi:uncharacterized protein LOC113564057 [Drosophila erecta]|uniref:uncharacterized protein LOC113564057 n=1 Tax=Drosophila erecta TaxID=7220 RepID=UPI000177F108|nr:uncharacterized protein LOC113564057 [Drosophila erecta]
MKFLAVLSAVLAVVLMTAVPVFGTSVPQCEPTAVDAAQGGSYPIIQLGNKVHYPPGRRMRI